MWLKRNEIISGVETQHMLEHLVEKKITKHKQNIKNHACNSKFHKNKARICHNMKYKIKTKHMKKKNSEIVQF